MKNPYGICEALTEILHVMLCYPDVYTDLRFASIYTMPLELCVAKNLNLDAETNNDGFFVTRISDQFCSNKEDLSNLR